MQMSQYVFVGGRKLAKEKMNYCHFYYWILPTVDGPKKMKPYWCNPEHQGGTDGMALVEDEAFELLVLENGWTRWTHQFLQE